MYVRCNISAALKWIYFNRKSKNVGKNELKLQKGRTPHSDQSPVPADFCRPRVSLMIRAGCCVGNHSICVLLWLLVSQMSAESICLKKVGTWTCMQVWLLKSNNAKLDQMMYSDVKSMKCRLFQAALYQSSRKMCEILAWWDWQLRGSRVCRM